MGIRLILFTCDGVSACGMVEEEITPRAGAVMPEMIAL